MLSQLVEQARAVARRVLPHSVRALLRPALPTRTRLRAIRFRVRTYPRRGFRLLGRAWQILCSEGPAAVWYRGRRKLRRYLEKRHACSLKTQHARRDTRDIPYSVMVSVIIPIYDRTDVLRTSIESILAQTLQNFEILLACDGSPAETLRVVHEFADHPKVRIFSWDQNTGGPVKGRDLMIAEARGKYVAFHDSDDIADPQRLQVCVEYLETGEADLVYGDCKILTKWTDDWRPHNLKDGQIIGANPTCDFELLSKVCVPIQSTVMARASALRMVGGLKPEMRYREDHELWLRLAHRNYRLKPVAKLLTALRLHPGNLELKHYGKTLEWYAKMIEVYPQRGPLLPRVAFLLYNDDISGGSAVLLQHAHRLQQMGHEVTVLTMSDKTDFSWFPYRSFSVAPFSAARHEMFDVLVATFWATAPVVDAIPAERKLYFVQADERCFYRGDAVKQREVLDTFHLDLEIVTVARWLQRWLKEDFGRDSHYLPNGIDSSLFRSAEPLTPKTSRPRVLIEGCIAMPFKGVENAFKAVAGLDCEVWCVSACGRPDATWRCDRFFEGVPHHDMKRLYSSCDVLLKMSEVESFCLPPLEMMACGQGACVIGDVDGIYEYAQNGVNALIVKKRDIEGARCAVQRLLTDPALRQRLIRNGQETARRFDWDLATARLQEVILGEPNMRPKSDARLLEATEWPRGLTAPLTKPLEARPRETLVSC